MVLLAIAGSALALVFAVQQYGNGEEDTQAATAAPPGSAPALAERDQGPAGLGKAEAKANALVGALTGSALPAKNGDGLPAFDIARIEPTGETVIAGRATPGATVELLRDGELHDSALADQSGQFVMVPTRLPPGTYDLTLRSKLLDGKQATSQHSVAVAIVPSPTDRPAMALMTPAEPTVLSRSDVSMNGLSKRPNNAAAHGPQLAGAGATVLAGGYLASNATTTVAAGDSLWRLSHLAYGAGTRYDVIYKANRNQIHNPNLIHPGQTFVLPARQ